MVAVDGLNSQYGAIQRVLQGPKAGVKRPVEAPEEDRQNEYHDD